MIYQGFNIMFTGVTFDLCNIMVMGVTFGWRDIMGVTMA